MYRRVNECLGNHWSLTFVLYLKFSDDSYDGAEGDRIESEAAWRSWSSVFVVNPEAFVLKIQYPIIGHFVVRSDGSGVGQLRFEI